MFMPEVYSSPLVSHRLLILVALFVVVATLLFMRLPIPPTFAGRTIENAGHMPVFLLVTLGLLIVLRQDFKFAGARLYALAGLLGVGLGLASEVIQRPLARDASWEDVFADTMGAVCALALYALFDRGSQLRRGARLAAFVVALGCIVFYVAPLVRMTAAYVHRNGQFPVLADFRSRIETFWIVGYGVSRSIERDALEIEFLRGRFPGVSLHEPVSDWSGFKTLLIDVENPDDVKLDFTVRVHDRGHGEGYADRFNRHFELAAAQRRTLRIELADVARAPKTRRMNMRHISDIRLFRDAPEGARRLRIYTLRLE
jgi:VanZ family protein